MRNITDSNLDLWRGPNLTSKDVFKVLVNAAMCADALLPGSALAHKKRTDG